MLWRAFDAAERLVAPRLEEALRTGTFAEALGLATRGQAKARASLEARSRRLWHLVNLPAGSDVAHLRRQVGQLDRELRRVSLALEQAMGELDGPEEVDDAEAAGERDAARPGRAAGARAQGRRAQRAARP
jgi:hypothetical protein